MNSRTHRIKNPNIHLSLKKKKKKKLFLIIYINKIENIQESEILRQKSAFLRSTRQLKTLHCYCCWREERQSERESWACWHWVRLRPVPPLEQRLRTASDSSGQAKETRHWARARFRCLQAASRAGPAGILRWHSISARWNRSHPSKFDIFKWVPQILMKLGGILIKRCSSNLVFLFQATTRLNEFNYQRSTGIVLR